MKRHGINEGMNNVLSVMEYMKTNFNEKKTEKVTELETSFSFLFIPLDGAYMFCGYHVKIRSPNQDLGSIPASKK